jgi:uncharacterized RDD family membrane protein YckC
LASYSNPSITANQEQTKRIEQKEAKQRKGIRVGLLGSFDKFLFGPVTFDGCLAPDATIKDAEKPAAQELQNSTPLPSFPLLPSVQILFYASVTPTRRPVLLTAPYLSASIYLQSMSWYYGVDGRSHGPVEEATLETLELSGAIEWATPIWRAGMTAWKPFGEIFRRPSVHCHECERSVDKEPAIRYRDLYICPRCKPLFFQKVREGLANEEAAQYCGFWIRFCARMLDGLILGALTVPLSIINQVIIFRTYPLTGPGAGMERFENTAQLGEFLTIQAAFVLVSHGRSATRFLGKMLSDLTMYIGYIMVGFDPQRRALHDHIADTRIIKRGQPAVPASNSR